MELFQILFTKPSKRAVFIYQILYILLCVLLTNKTLEAFGIVYSNPKNIEMPLAIHFILSGQVIAPVFTFIVFYVLIEQIILFTGLRFVYYFFLRNFYSDVVGYIANVGKVLHWFEENNTMLEKGRNFKGFVRLLKSFEPRGYNVIRKNTIIASICLASVVNSFLFPIPKAIAIVLVLVSVLVATVCILNALLLLAMEDRLYFFESMKNDLANNRSVTII